MTKAVQTASLHNNAELITEYEKAHRKGNVPEDVISSIAGSGISSMKIYRAYTQLFMLIETDDSFDTNEKAKADAGNPHVREWETKMAKYQDCPPDALP